MEIKKLQRPPPLFPLNPFQLLITHFAHLLLATLALIPHHMKTGSVWPVIDLSKPFWLHDLIIR